MYGFDKREEDNDSNDDISANISITDTLRRHREKLRTTLFGKDSISLDELQEMDPESLPVYKDWFVKILKHSSRLHQQLDTDFLEEV